MSFFLVRKLSTFYWPKLFEYCSMPRVRLMERKHVRKLGGRLRLDQRKHKPRNHAIRVVRSVPDLQPSHHRADINHVAPCPQRLRLTPYLHRATPLPSPNSLQINTHSLAVVVHSSFLGCRYEHTQTSSSTSAFCSKQFIFVIQPANREDLLEVAKTIEVV